MINLKRFLSVSLTTAVLSVGMTPVASAIVNPIFVNDDDPVADSVALVVVPRGDNLASFCTGALIDPEWVITASHCFGLNDEYVPGGEFVSPEQLVYQSINESLPIMSGSSSGSSSSSNSAPVEVRPTDDNNNPTISLGPIRDKGEKRKVTHVYSHPDGMEQRDMALLKLDRPVYNVKPMEMNNEIIQNVYNVDTRTYGWSHLTTNDSRLRYLEGKTDFWENETYTRPLNGATTEFGDSGGPIVDKDGKLVSVHYAGRENSVDSYGFSIGPVYDWIQETIRTK